MIYYLYDTSKYDENHAVVALKNVFIYTNNSSHSKGMSSGCVTGHTLSWFVTMCSSQECVFLQSMLTHLYGL